MVLTHKFTIQLDKALSIGLIMVLTHKFTIQLDKALSVGLIMVLTHKFTIVIQVNTIMRPIDRALSNLYMYMLTVKILQSIQIHVINMRRQFHITYTWNQ
jgi:hypothetical protein